MRFEASVAASGAEAVTFIRTFRYDAVLLDIATPGMDGVEACRELRRLRPNLGILMITVRDREEMIIRVLDARGR